MVRVLRRQSSIFWPAVASQSLMASCMSLSRRLAWRSTNDASVAVLASGSVSRAPLCPVIARQSACSAT